MGFFNHVEMAADDPILGLNAAFSRDARLNKVNLGVGVYKSTELQPLVLSCVKKAEEKIFFSSLSKEYLPIDGNRDFLRLSENLLLGEGTEALSSRRVYSAQTIGGSGALSLGADFLYQEGYNRLFLSEPSWSNHKKLFAKAGFQIDSYPYLERKRCMLDFENMCAGIKKMPQGSVILLHACCHNPTGVDPSLEQWKEISSLIKAQKAIPFFDFAYHGFAEGLEKDPFPIRYFVEEGHEMLVAYSFSKNFGLYGERLGALFVITEEEKIVEKVKSRVKQLIRSRYSSPPIHGSRIVKEILEEESLLREWAAELENMRLRINEMRKALASELLAQSQKIDFSFMHEQRGMFSFSGLDRDHVDRLAVEYGIYMPSNGRINVAGLSSENLDYVVGAILTVLSSREEMDG